MTEVVTRAVGIAFAAVRSGIQYVVAGLVGWLASIGIQLDAEQSKLVEIIVGAVVFAAVVAAIRWMETLQGDAPWQRWVRRLGTVLMAGTSVLQPSYGRTVDGQVTSSETAPTGETPRRSR